MFLDWKNQHCENDYTTQSNLQNQCNLLQTTSVIFHRIMHMFPSKSFIVLASKDKKISGKWRDNLQNGRKYFKIINWYKYTDNELMSRIYIDQCWVNFCVWYEVWGPISYFYMWVACHSSTIFEKTVLSTLSCLGTHVKINCS